MKHYTHLSQDERYQIYSMKSHGITISQMAIHLDRSESTLRREIKRNSGKKGYRPKQAQQLSQLRSLGSRNGPVIAPSVWLQVDELTRQDYSPEQIAGKLKASAESI
jgi:transposase, IS30 family